MACFSVKRILAAQAGVQHVVTGATQQGVIAHIAHDDLVAGVTLHTRACSVCFDAIVAIGGQANFGGHIVRTPARAIGKHEGVNLAADVEAAVGEEVVDTQELVAVIELHAQVFEAEIDEADICLRDAICEFDHIAVAGISPCDRVCVVFEVATKAIDADQV